MLYDNALLSRVNLHAYQASGDPFFRRVVEEMLDYVLREMTCVDACIDTQQLRSEPQLPSNAPGVAGGFYSTQDADSEGEEDKFLSGRRTRQTPCWGRQMARCSAPTLT